jgi:hypothetical protein
MVMQGPDGDNVFGYACDSPGKVCVFEPNGGAAVDETVVEVRDAGFISREEGFQAPFLLDPAPIDLNVDYIYIGSTIRTCIDKDYGGNPYRMSLYTDSSSRRVPDPSAWKVDTQTLYSSTEPSDGNVNEKPLIWGNGTGNPFIPRSIVNGTGRLYTLMILSRSNNSECEIC